MELHAAGVASLLRVHHTHGVTTSCRCVGVRNSPTKFSADKLNTISKCLHLMSQKTLHVKCFSQGEERGSVAVQ